jgi:hypothetical protein
VVCDYCREEFTAVIPNPAVGFDPKTAAAICPPCAQEMRGVYEFGERSEQQAFAKRMAESVARKLGVLD